MNLFSDFGGNIGLWIGFSVITFAEFAELLCEVEELLQKRNSDHEFQICKLMYIKGVIYVQKKIQRKEYTSSSLMHIDFLQRSPKKHSDPGEDEVSTNESTKELMSKSFG